MTPQRDRFAAAIELGTRLEIDWPHLERRIRDTIPDLKAASYDAEPRDALVWCDTHERPVSTCHDHDDLCTGTPLEARTDPTGDAAATHPYRDAGEFVAHARRAAHHIERMAVIAARYQVVDPRESAEVEQENTKPDGCEVCARSGKWVPVHVEAANPNGVLRKPIRSCRWHFDFVAVHGRLPDEREEAIHQAGGRVTVRATKQMDRLRRGLVNGRLGA